MPSTWRCSTNCFAAYLPARRTGASASLSCAAKGELSSSGGDIKVIEQILKEDAYTFMRDWIRRVHLLEMQLRTIPKPVIASIQGVASGQGMNLALACDLRLAAESARFNQSFGRLGLTSEGTYFLPRLVGTGKATELFFTGETLTAADALSLGIVNRVVPDAELQAETARWASKDGSRPNRSAGADEASDQQQLHETARPAPGGRGHADRGNRADRGF